MSTFEVSFQDEVQFIDVVDGQCLLRDRPEASASEVSPGVFSVLVDGKSFRVLVSREGDSYMAACEGTFGRVQVGTERSRILKRFTGISASHARKAEIHAPMPALVVKVEVHAGQSVEKGEGLVILEAMKMENELRAPHGGIVKKVLVAEGAKVEKGELILLLE